MENQPKTEKDAESSNETNFQILKLENKIDIIIPSYSPNEANTKSKFQESSNLMLEKCDSFSSSGSNTHPPLSGISSNLFGIDTPTNSNSQSIFYDNNPSLYIFTTRKVDSVFEKFGSKKSIITIEVDVEARTVSFVNTNDVREVYSCAVVNAKIRSRTNLSLKIQTGSSIVSKRCSFLTLDDRENFLRVLEHGKVVSRSGLQRLGSDIEQNTINQIHMKKRNTSNLFCLMGGEYVIDHVHRATCIVIISQKERAVQGDLRITNFRMVFIPYDETWMFGSFVVPIVAVDEVVCEGLMLIITCKDFRTIRLALHDAYTSTQNDSNQPPCTPNQRWINSLMEKIRPAYDLHKLFAFSYDLERKTKNLNINGWLVFSPVAEYQRIGLLHKGDHSDIQHENPQNIHTLKWRLLKNSSFRFSPTYPQLMVVPSILTEDQLVQSARFRSKARLPVVIWQHPQHGCVLARSSQPNYGMTSQRSEADQLLLRLFRSSARRSNGIEPQIHIVDARKPIATQGNRLRGKGVENSQHYDGAIIEFMGIANIHKMRESINSIIELFSPNVVSDGDKYYHTRLENTRWLKHVMRLLSASSRVAEILHEKGASVLVHCSDGWDRTPQIVAMAELILDPYYRTIRGFAVLIEKEWCSFGHKFSDRVGVDRSPSDASHERSPVFIQWLDCVWQLLRQYPTCFEFEEKLLLYLADSLTSGLYGTFLLNSEKERYEHKISEKTISVWSHVLDDIKSFQNNYYKPTQRPLYPRANLKKIVVWESLFLRWDPENDPNWTALNESEESKPIQNSLSEYDVNIADNPKINENENDLNSIEPSSNDIEEKEEETFGESSSSSSDEVEEEEAQSIKISTRNSGRNSFAQHLMNHTEDQEFLKMIRKRRIEGARQRTQARNIREALEVAPEKNRIKYLEQLISESIARELQLEALMESYSSQFLAILKETGNAQLGQKLFQETMQHTNVSQIRLERSASAFDGEASRDRAMLLAQRDSKKSTLNFIT